MTRILAAGLNVLRVGVLMSAALFAAASATAPAAHHVDNVTTVPASFDATWTAAIDILAQYKVAVSSTDKASGFIATDWMRLDDDTQSNLMDCGGDGAMTNQGTRAKFNVRVKPKGNGAELSINVTFQRVRTFFKDVDVVECTSRGVIEGRFREKVLAQSAANQATQMTVTKSPPVAPLIFYCTNSPADATHALCARSQAGCAKRQTELVDSIGDATPCAERTGAICLKTRTVSGEIVESCHPTAEACNRQHAADIAASKDLVGDCAPAL